MLTFWFTAFLSFFKEYIIYTHSTFKNKLEGFPGGTAVKNPPANAGDTGSSSGQGRCHRATKPMCHNY